MGLLIFKIYQFQPKSTMIDAFDYISGHLPHMWMIMLKKFTKMHYLHIINKFSSLKLVSGYVYEVHGVVNKINTT